MSDQDHTSPPQAEVTITPTTQEERDGILKFASTPPANSLEAIYQRQLRRLITDLDRVLPLLDEMGKLVRDVEGDHEFAGEERGEQCQVCLFVARYHALMSPHAWEASHERPVHS